MKSPNLDNIFILANDSDGLNVLKKINTNFSNGKKTRINVVGFDEIERRIEVFFITESSMVNIDEHGFTDIYYFDKIKKLKINKLEIA